MMMASSAMNSPSTRRLQSMASERSFSINQMTLTEGDEDEFGVVEENRVASNNNSSSSNKLHEDDIVRQASRRVRWASHALVSYLVLAGLGCAVGTAWTIQTHQVDQYEHDFDTAASTLGSALTRDFQRMLGSLQVLTHTLQQSSQLQWPYVTVPTTFAAQAGIIHQQVMGGVQQLTLLPVVHNITQWQAFVASQSQQRNNDEMESSLWKNDESLTALETPPNTNDAAVFVTTTHEGNNPENHVMLPAL